MVWRKEPTQRETKERVSDIVQFVEKLEQSDGEKS